MEKGPRINLPEITPEQAAQIAAIEIMPFRPENASTSLVTSHIVYFNGEPVRIHELNNFPAIFLRKYFSYINRDRPVNAVNLKKEVGEWLPVMSQLAQKAPDLYQAIASYDRSIMQINQANFIYRGIYLKAETQEERDRIQEQWQQGLQDLNRQFWPTDQDVAERDVRWAMAYDTICEIAKIIAPHLDRQAITEEANLA